MNSLDSYLDDMVNPPKGATMAKKDQEEGQKFVCANDEAEMNYHASTDQWQCPVCGSTEKTPVLVKKADKPAA